MILPAVNYGLVLWGSCGNSDLFKSIERHVQYILQFT